MLPNLDTDLLRAFVAVADSKSFTRAGQVLCRTQAAISMQVKRLEGVVDKQLFNRNSRTISLTPEGEFLLGYARRMLRLSDEVMTSFTEPDLQGVVRVGAPDDYATYFLPRVLPHFTQTHPQVRVEVRCDNSVDLLSVLADGQLDLALVTRHPESRGGETIRREPLHWVTAQSHLAHEEDPLPLAVFPQGCVCRDVALRALEGINRQWRIAYSSRSISAIQGAVSAGFAVSVMEQSTLPEDVRTLSEDEGFPALPDIEVALHRAPGELTAPVQRFADLIRTRLSDH